MKELSIGVIGVGGRGGVANHAHKPEDGVRIVAGADPYEPARVAFAERYGEEAFVTEDYRDLLARNDVDAVFICSPDYCHEEQAVGVKPIGAFSDYLQFGVYPYYFEYEDRDLFRATLEQNVHTAIESDLPAVHPKLTGVSIARIKMLLAALSASVPLTPDLVKLRRLLDIADDRTLKTYLGYLEDAGLIMAFGRTGRELKAMDKPRKIYLGDVNEAQALQPTGRADIGSLRETFFAQSVSVVHRLRVPDTGDFAVDSGTVFEVGGRNKTTRQVRGVSEAFLALDGIEVGVGSRVPLWLFGFLY